MTGREVDHGWWAEPDGRQSRLTWSEDLGGTLYLFRATGESEALVAGVGEDDVALLVGHLWDRPGRSAATVREAVASRWP